MKKLALLISRGSGSPGFDSQKKFLEKFYRDLEKNDMPQNALEVGFIDWYERLENEQEKLVELIEKKTDVKGLALRKFLLTNIADLINYRGGHSFDSNAYKKTHEAVYNSISEMQSRVDENAPLCILASSMGTEIINNHIWDRQQWGLKNPDTTDPFASTPFEKMQTLMGLFTLGNNIPIFASAYKIEDLKPISFPGIALSNNHKAHSLWENIYDKHDPMGYPIKFINNNYRHANVQDVQMNVGGLLTGWNLSSHLRYWNSRRLRKHLARKISDVWKAL